MFFPIKIIKFGQHQRDLLLLLACFTLLILALLRPSVPVKHNVYSYFIVLDITQSMNSQDMQIAGKPATRLAYTKKLVREALTALPCGTKVGIGIFSGVNVVAMYVPIDVCENFSSLQDTLDHIDWRSAWTADSRIRESLLSAAQVINNFPEPTQVVYFSDGEEAPKLHAFNTRDLSTLQNADGWLLVGVGSEAGAAIPKYDAHNQLIGYWSHESMQLAPGAAPIAAAGILQRKSDIAESPNERYVSKLANAYMQSLAKEIGATYLQADGAHGLIQALKNQKPARNEWTPLMIDFIFATCAALLLLYTYIPKHPIQAFRRGFRQLLVSVFVKKSKA